MGMVRLDEVTHSRLRGYRGIGCTFSQVIAMLSDFFDENGGQRWAKARKG